MPTEERDGGIELAGLFDAKMPALRERALNALVAAREALNKASDEYQRRMLVMQAVISHCKPNDFSAAGTAEMEEVTVNGVKCRRVVIRGASGDVEARYRVVGHGVVKEGGS